MTHNDLRHHYYYYTFWSGAAGSSGKPTCGEGVRSCWRHVFHWLSRDFMRISINEHTFKDATAVIRTFIVALPFTSKLSECEIKIPINVNTSTRHNMASVTRLISYDYYLYTDPREHRPVALLEFFTGAEFWIGPNRTPNNRYVLPSPETGNRSKPATGIVDPVDWSGPPRCCRKYATGRIVFVVKAIITNLMLKISRYYARLDII